MKKVVLLVLGLILFSSQNIFSQHKIYFCGEEVPVANDFVANKLMQYIKNQIPTARLASLRYKTNAWFPWLEAQLTRAGLPTDLKYLPIVESQFKNVARSAVGAAGLWQIMPKTATGLGLLLNPDERLNPEKATYAACKLLRDYFLMVKRWNNGRGSWPLTCAAYNWGPGNIQKAMANQGSNYFTLNINPETATYVYKIIAVKELWEHPERYMKNFDRNVFEKEQMQIAKQESLKQKDRKVYTVETNNEKVEIELLDDVTDNSDKLAYDDEIYEMHEQSFDLSSKDDSENENNDEEFSTSSKEIGYSEIMAALIPIGKEFKDGGLISIQLKEDLMYRNGNFSRKDKIIKGTGWIIDDRVMVQLSNDIEVFYENVKGIPLSILNKKKNPILILKVIQN